MLTKNGCVPTILDTQELRLGYIADYRSFEIMSAADLTTDVWRIDDTDFPAEAPIQDRIRFLLRYAILAPSSHNSQPWSFRIDGNTVHIHADESRWLDVADSDRRELLISLGCALENLLVAAAHFGFETTVGYGFGEEEPVASVQVAPMGRAGGTDDESLFEAIPARRTSHGAFEDRPIPSTLLDRFRAMGRDEAVDVMLVVDAELKGRIAELQFEADERQMADPAYRRELGHWIGMGALGASWLMARVGQLAVTYLDMGGREASKNSKLIERAPIVAVLSTPVDTQTARVQTGQVFERLMLAATGDRVVVHPMSQILERPELKRELANELGIEPAIPQHLFRLGYPRNEPEASHTPRWPVSAVLR